MENKRKLRDEIIKFVQDSPEEINSQLAVFIAGMQAQKNLTAGQRKPDKDMLSIVRPASMKKQGG